MPLIEINWRPTDRQLRQFGVVCMIALPLLAWLWGGGLQVWFWGVALRAVSLKVVVGAAAIGAALAVLGCVRPRALKPLFLGLSILAAPIGVVLGELAMAFLYWAVFLPVAIAFRLAGRDALQKRFDRPSPTYWRPKKQPRSVESYYHQS